MLRGDGQSGFRGDERGVTVQVGAVLLFGILIVALATWQAAVVPDQNADVEFEHSRTVQSDVADLRNGILRTGVTGNPHPASVSLGTRYPSRTLFVNPPPASGSLETVGTDDGRVNVTLENAALDSEYENAREYWTGDPSAGRYDTGTLVYTPGYTQYRNAPTVVYENGLVVNQFDGGDQQVRSGQTLVSGNVLTLLTLRGSLGESRAGDYTVETRAVSEATGTVTVRSTAEEPLVVAVTSRLPAATWESSILAGEAAVADVTERATWEDGGVTYHRVAVELEPGSYELRAGSVGVGALTDDEARPDPAYLVAVDDYRTVGNETNGTMRVEVRDRFNNPLSDAAVDVRVDTDHLRVWNGSAWNATATLRTDADGRATVSYRAVNVTSSGESAWLNASLAGASESYEYRNFSDRSVPVVAVGDGGDLNPGQPDDVHLENVSRTGDVYRLAFANGAPEDRTVTYARVNVYVVQKQGGGGGGGDDAPTYGDLYAVTDPTERTRLDVGGPYANVDPGITVARDGTRDVEIEFDRTPNNDASWFVLTLVFENGERATYIVSVGS